MNRWAGRVAVVTGASSGIGLSIVKALVREGLIVVGISRRKEKMEDTMKHVKGKGKFYAIQCDIGKEQNVIQAFEWIKKILRTVHVLVNNAGVSKVGNISDMDSEDIRKTFDVNVLGVLYCSRQALRLMKEGGHESHIINISSVVGQQNIIADIFGSNVYIASKRAVTGISETLRGELFGAKIRVTNISPGFTKTDIVEASGDTLPPIDTPVLEPVDIANSIVYVLGTPSRVEVTELIIRPLGEKL